MWSRVPDQLKQVVRAWISGANNRHRGGGEQTKGPGGLRAQRAQISPRCPDPRHLDPPQAASAGRLLPGAGRLNSGCLSQTCPGHKSSEAQLRCPGARSGGSPARTRGHRREQHRGTIAERVPPVRTGTKAPCKQLHSIFTGCFSGATQSQLATMLRRALFPPHRDGTRSGEPHRRSRRRRPGRGGA